MGLAVAVCKDGLGPVYYGFLNIVAACISFWISFGFFLALHPEGEQVPCSGVVAATYGPVY